MEQTLELEEIGTVNHDSCHIVVMNDDHNTVDHVIDTFMKVLKHPREQAEQLTLMIHTKGQARVKHGTFEELQPPTELLIDAGLDATIE
jgi:ATP-dependent Clp protease adaptor protein ClpS